MKKHIHEKHIHEKKNVSKFILQIHKTVFDI